MAVMAMTIRADLSNKAIRHALPLLLVVWWMLFAPSLSVAKMILSTDISLREEFTDNVFLDPNREQDDLITTVAPSLSLQLDSRPVDGKLTYGLEYKKYMDNTSEDETDLQDIQRGDMDLVLFPDREFSIRLNGSIDRVTIDERRQTSERASLVNMSNQYRLMVRPNYRRRFSPTLTGELAYQYDLINYESSEGDDSYSHTLELLVEKALTSSLSSDLSGSLSSFKDDFNPDYERQDLRLGLEWSANPSLKVVARGGAIRLDYDDRSAVTRGVGKLALSIGASKPWQAVFSYGQDYELSNDDGLIEKRKAEAQLTRKGRLSGALSLYQTKDDYQSADREDKYYGTTLTVGYQLSRSLEASVSGHYRYQKFQPEDESGHRYGGSAELAQTGKIYRIALGYAYTENRSSPDVNSYRENLFYLEGRLHFGTSAAHAGE